jgi:hypothetical protein
MFSQPTLRKVAEALCKREVDSMSLDELRNAAIDSRISEFQNAAGGVSQNDLLDSLLMRFDGDTDLVREFMVENGMDEDDAEVAIANFMA